MDALDTLPSASALMTRADAYRAMLHLIKYYYRFGDEYRIGAMLGDLSPGVWEDGMAGDSGAWELCSMLSPASFRNPIEHRKRTLSIQIGRSRN